jgi:hypothetical protein
MPRRLTIVWLATAAFAPIAGVDGQTLAMTRTDSVIVMVRAARGDALYGANIQYRTSGSLANGRYDGSTGTDEQGRGAFPRPTTDTTTIRVRAIGFVPQVLTIRLDTVQSPLRIVLQLDTMTFGPPPPQSGPVGKVRLVVRDPRPEPRRTTRPLILSLETEKQYGCLGYGIWDRFERRDRALRVVLLGIQGAPPVCATAMGPAISSLPMDLEAGRYLLVVEAQSERRADSLWLDVSDSSVKLTAQRLSFITSDERLWWRYPQRVVALTCEGDEVRTRPVCDDFRRWVATRTGITVHAFGLGGVNPFWPDTLKPDRRFYTFRVDDERVLAEIFDCLAEVNLAIKDAVGVGLGIETWKGDRHSIFSSRSFHEKHIEIPQRVTAGPICAQT